MKNKREQGAVRVSVPRRVRRDERGLEKNQGFVEAAERLFHPAFLLLLNVSNGYR